MVRRIAVVFEALCPQHVADDVVAMRLIESTELAAEIAGVEILPRGAHEVGAQLAGGRKHFWERAAMRRDRAPRPALSAGSDG